MQFSAKQIENIYSTKGITYMYDNKEKTIIDEAKYLKFEPYHIIGCYFYTYHDSKLRTLIKAMIGIYFDENMILHKFKLDMPKHTETLYWKREFIENTMNTKIITCNTKCTTPYIKNRESVELICDSLSLVHTHAYSVALDVMQHEKTNQYDKFIELYNDYDSFKAYRNKSYVSNLILSVKTPKFERTPENKNTKTFDRIRCDISLRSFENDQKIEFDKLTDYVKNDIDNIFNDVINAIENCKRWQSFDIPINVLACTHARVCRDYTLELIFEIKELD